MAEGRIPDTDEDGNAVFPEARTEIDEGVHQLETLLESTVDKNFDKLEIYALRNILTVPEDLAPWVRLSHYRGLDFIVTADTLTIEQLIVLRREVHETRRLNNALQAESHRNAAIISQLRALLHPPAEPTNGGPASSTSLSFLVADPAAQNLKVDFSTTSTSAQPLHTSIAQTTNQVAELRRLHELLRSKAGQLNAPRQGEDTEERRQYIESQTKRRLEQDGIDVESGEGLSRGGFHAAALGRGVGNDEVRAIEQVVGLMGEERQGTTGADDGDTVME